MREPEFVRRNARRLDSLGQHEDVLKQQVFSVMPAVRRELGLPDAPEGGLDISILALGDGDAYLAPTDGPANRDALANVFFIYFFHAEPRAFEGGDIKLQLVTQRGAEQGDRIIGRPRQNGAVFARAGQFAEIEMVRVASRAFAEGSFAVIGYVHS
jgi:hypothetical protein